MNDLANITGRLVPAETRVGKPNAPTRERSLDDATPSRINAGGFKDTPEQIASLIRLDRVLSTDQPPRSDVPRGYYLDMLV